MWEIRQEGRLSWTGDVVICSAGMSALVKTRTCNRRARSCERFEYIAAAVRRGSLRLPEGRAPAGSSLTGPQGRVVTDILLGSQLFPL